MDGDKSSSESANSSFSSDGQSPKRLAEDVHEPSPPTAACAATCTDKELTPPTSSRTPAMCVAESPLLVKASASQGSTGAAALWSGDSDIELRSDDKGNAPCAAETPPTPLAAVVGGGGGRANILRAKLSAMVRERQRVDYAPPEVVAIGKVVLIFFGFRSLRVHVCVFYLYVYVLFVCLRYAVCVLYKSPSRHISVTHIEIHENIMADSVGIPYQDFRDALPGDDVRGNSYFRFEWNSDNSGCVIVTQLTKGNAHVEVTTALQAEFTEEAMVLLGRGQGVFSAMVEKNHADAEVHMEADASFVRDGDGTSEVLML